MTRSKPRKHSEVAGALVARAATITDSIADAGHSSDALAVVLAVVQAQTQQIASLVDLVHLLAAQPARPAAAAAPVASAAGAPAAERPAAAGAARAASARGPSRRGGLPARVGETSLCRSHVLSIPVAAATRLIVGRGSEGQMARDGIVRGALRDASYLGSTRHVRRQFSDCYGSEETAVAAAAVRFAAAAVDGVSLPVCLAMNLVRFVHVVSGRDRPAGGGVVSASFLNAKPAVGGIVVEPRRGGVLRVLFTVASDAVADTVVRSRRNLRDVDPSAAVFDVLSEREEAQHRALWPAFLAAKAAEKRAQFHHARLVVDGERELLRVLSTLGVPQALALRFVGKELDWVIVGRHALRNSQGVGEKMAGLASVLGIDMEAAAVLSTRCPNLINRRMDTLAGNLDALQACLGLPRDRIGAMVLRYPPLLDLSPGTLRTRVGQLSELLGLDADSGMDTGTLQTALEGCPSWLGQARDTVISKVDAVEGLLARLYADAAQTGHVHGGGGGGTRAQACRLLLAFPGLLSVSTPKLRSKFDRLGALAAGNAHWGAEISGMSLKSLGRCLAASQKVLDRLAFFQDTDMEPTGPSGRAIGLLNLVTMSASEFKDVFPSYAYYTQGTQSRATAAPRAHAMSK
ncbi:hypothetical protein FOA52_011251 [Chlamydomonas sp. UWO 241]|nr:hypothetical protein FOA52_011251 [Chlamydomonas sp. UWO 241]